MQHNENRSHPWWRHQMETLSALLAICAGNSPVPTQRPVTRSFDVFLICVRIIGWVNNSDAGELRRYRAHYDVIVMHTHSKPTEVGNCIHPPPMAHLDTAIFAITSGTEVCRYDILSFYQWRQNWHPGDSQLKVIECFTGDGDYHTELHSLDTLRPRQYGRHSTDDIFNWIFLKENVWFLLKFHWGLGFTKQYSGIGSDNGLAPTIVAVTCFISSIKSCPVLCFTIMSSIDSVLLLKVLFRQAWRPTYVRMNWALSFVHIIARWRLFHGKSLPEPMLTYCQWIIKPWW